MPRLSEPAWFCDSNSIRWKVCIMKLTLCILLLLSLKYASYIFLITACKHNMQECGCMINPTELSPTQEATSCAATQEFPNILWNLKFRYRVCKSPQLVSDQSQISAVHTVPSYLSKIHFNIMQLANRPARRLMRNYFLIILFTLYWIRAN
jgi:hypothetical protein